MRPRASLCKAHLVIVIVPMVLAASTLLLAQASSARQESPTLTLEKLAREKFGKLTPTELRVVEAAASGDVAWGDEEIGQPETDAALEAAYRKQSNNPAKATDYNWRDRRNVRADLIRWLCKDEEARKLVDQHGIDIVGAWIDGAVDLSQLHINFPVILKKCLIPQGIKLTSAEISDLELVGSWIGEDLAGASGLERKALEGERLTVHGNVLLSNGFRAFRQVDLSDAKIEGQLYCTAGHFSDPGGNSLLLRLASIGGETSLRGGFSSDGVVDLEDAKINGDLLLDGADFSADSHNGIRARHLTALALRWTHVRISDQTELDLSNANIGIFEDDRQSWPAPGHLLIDGFVYGTLQGDASYADARLAWLNLQPLPHRRQPYEQLAKVFFDSGQSSDATLVRFENAVGLFRSVEVCETVWQKQLLDRVSVKHLTGAILERTVGFGYFPFGALRFMAFFVTAGTILFGIGYSRGYIAPTEESAFDYFAKHRQPAPNYPPFNALLYSVEAFVPLITFHQSDTWFPISGRHKGWGATFLRGYMSFHMIAGWTLVTLFVISLAPDGPARLNPLWL